MAPSTGVLLLLTTLCSFNVNAHQDLDLDNDGLMDVQISENKEHKVLGKASKIK
jgi:hypothetical protein